MRIRRVLHATDFSPASTRAFRYATDLATMHRAQLVILHVMTPPALGMPGEGYVTPQIYDTLEASARRQAGKRLDALVARARTAGARARGMLLEGVPHELIVRAVRSQKADLLVIGTHGRSGLAKFFLGSVASRLVSTAGCPVLTVRGR
ncbi:MAG TPA: universal stress protein [Candidatus Bathyarchaeia archaeon]|nr:universal stress protein [Candidatus Bathyarchaeia archaeon]